MTGCDFVNADGVSNDAPHVLGLHSQMNHNSYALPTCFVFSYYGCAHREDLIEDVEQNNITYIVGEQKQRILNCQ